MNYDDKRLVLIERKGGKCQICGYNKCKSALDFHHIDPNTKKFNISGSSLNNPPVVILNELEKTVLLCKNCHAETHQRLSIENNK